MGVGFGTGNVGGQADVFDRVKKERRLSDSQHLAEDPLSAHHRRVSQLMVVFSVQNASSNKQAFLLVPTSIESDGYSNK